MVIGYDRDMQHYHKNPRQITKTQMSDLKASMDELGDLSGITHDLDTDELLTGNQRCEALPGVMSGLIQPEITQSFDPPLEDGTTLLGYFLVDGRMFNYRAVKGWDDKKRELANLRANKVGGTWDWDIMANEFDVETLLDSGFTDEDLTGADFPAPDFQPVDESEQSRLDKKSPITCPKCKHEFVP